MRTKATVEAGIKPSVATKENDNIAQETAAMDSCFGRVEPHPVAWHSNSL